MCAAAPAVGRYARAMPTRHARGAGRLPGALLVALGLCAASIACGCAAPMRVLTVGQATPINGRRSEHAAVFPLAAVAADHELASLAGAEVLAAGGNAIDAAVATSLTLSVVRPFSCGIGGGGFMLVVTPEAGRALAINYRETAPAAVGPGYFQGRADPNASVTGPHAVGVPGTVAGLMHAHERLGRLPRQRVLAPAIRAARQGFVADAAYAGAVRSALRRLRSDPAWPERFPYAWSRLFKAGQVRVGDLITNPRHAEALELIARDGAAAFYQGPIGQQIVATLQREGGTLTAEDLRRYAVAEDRPIRTRFGDSEIVTFPPPSSGGLAIAQVLGILEREMAQSPQPLAGEPPTHTPVWTAAVVEAFKHAFADRAAFLADPRFVGVPVERLTSAAYLDELADRTEPGVPKPIEGYGSGGAAAPLPADGGTSHLSVVDADGGAVACTETINTEFGSLVFVERFGFFLNNEMDDFTTQPGAANSYGLRQSDANLPAPGKRPLSSMSPTIVLRLGDPPAGTGRVRAVAGASGGPRIITGTAQALLNTLVLGMDAAAAVEHPRVHHQWQPDQVSLEGAARHGPAGDPAQERIAQWLRDRGYAVVPAGGESTVQMIVSTPDGWHAASDPRKGGKPAGIR